MSGIALFVTDTDMYTQAVHILKDLKGHHVSQLRLTSIEDVVSEAQKAIAQGVNIIVARGRQALEIKKNTNITVTDIVITAQELGLLVMRAKSIVDKEQVTIGLFGWGDMFCDTTYFEQLYDIKLKRYILSDNEEWRNIVYNSTNDQLDIIIGGRLVLECARQIGIPGIYLAGTGESLTLAIQTAESLYRIAESEKHHYAQFSSVLDSSSNGIIKLSSTGKILIMNTIMEDILGTSSKELIGLPIHEVFTEVHHDKVSPVLNGTSDSFSILFTYKGQELVLAMGPIVVGDEIEGAIMSFNRLRHLDTANKSVMTKHFLSGHTANSTFDDISKNIKGLHKVIELAKLYALSSSPILIKSLAGPELDNITQSIHNYGMRRNGPFIIIHIAGLTEDQQSIALFGNSKTKEIGALESANHGTLVLQGIDKLSLPVQYNFIKAIQTKRLSLNYSPSDFKAFDTRIIACTAKDLAELRKDFLFRSDLYFTLNSLRLTIPSLKDRPGDVEYFLTTYLNQFMKQYSRYHVLSPRAKKLLMEYPWEGNIVQLESFCERLILTAEKRNITEEYVRSLLDELYYNAQDPYTDSRAYNLEHGKFQDDPADPMYDLIVKTLTKHGGSRQLTANELQISTTTLWRRMKKYGLIDSDT